MRPWNQPTALPSMSAATVRLDQFALVERTLNRAPAVFSLRSISAC